MASLAGYSAFIVSVDIDTNRRTKKQQNRHYYRLKKRLKRLGVPLGPTMQIKILLSKLSPSAIRDDLVARLKLKSYDSVYVGKIAKGSAWFSPRDITDKTLKTILRTLAEGAEPTRDEIRDAKARINRMLYITQ